MAKLPGFMWYPGDWLKDPGVRRCSHAAKGVYMDVLCLMFECEERGVLATVGQAWSDEEIARAVGGDLQQTLACISELVEKGVVSRNQSGCMYSRRMVRDEEKRKLCAEAGRRGGGNPAFSSTNSGSKGRRKGRNKGPPKVAYESEYENETEDANENAFESEPSLKVQESTALIQEVYAHYRVYHPRACAKLRSDSTEWKKIRARLRDGYSAADLKAAIDGNHRSPWHCGENNNGTEYHNLELIVRDSDHVRKFIEIAAARNGSVMSEKTRRNVRAAKSYLEKRSAADGSK